MYVTFIIPILILLSIKYYQYEHIRSMWAADTCDQINFPCQYLKRFPETVYNSEKDRFIAYSKHMS